MKPLTQPMKNILLIDDDEDDCLFMARALAAISNSISLCWTQPTDQLLEMIACNKPSMIFINFYLPKENALDCLRQIRNQPDYKDIPVVMWSTSLIQNNVAAAFWEGARAFVQKPYSLKELIQELRAILKQFRVKYRQTLCAAKKS
jgi:CheY-like chemotaxis protein